MVTYGDVRVGGTAQEHASVIMRNLSVNAENKIKIVQEGALKPLVALLRSRNEVSQPPTLSQPLLSSPLLY